MANKPRIRFRGFTEDWEQRKFLDLLDTQNGIRRGPFGSSLKKDSFVKKSDYVVYEQQNAIYDNYVTRYFISKEKYNELIRFNIQPGDFIMSGAGTIGRISMVPDGIKKGVFNQALIRFKVDKNSVNPLYFLKFMQSDMMQKQLTQANPGSAMTNLVPMDELKKWDVTIPSLEEQNKISNFINQIDESITLHQCKLKKLNLAKKSLLQKLFPRNGSQIPGVRFKGFTDAWEQRKFLDLLDTQNGIRRGPFGSSLKKDSFVKKSDYVVYEQQNAIYDNYVTRYFISKEKYNELIRFNIQPGDFIMSGAGTIGRISMVPDGIKKGVFNQALIRFKVDKNSVNPLYFLKFMQSDMMQKQLTQANPGSAMTNLVPMDELKKWDVTIPSLEEQNKISNFINQIDESITLHQRKLERLQEVKKGLLQKMFV